MKARTRLYLKLYSKVIIGYLFIFVVYFSFATFFGKYIEAVAIMLSYLLTREVFPTTYHCKSSKKCIETTIFVFCGVVALVMPINISLLFALIYGFCISLMLFIVQSLINAYTPKEFNLDTCTESELIAKCKALHFSEENIDLAVEFFIKKTKQSIIADRLCVQEKSITTRKSRLKKLLEK